MDRKRSPGMLTPLLLAGLVLLGSFSWAFLRTAAQGLKTQQLQQEARQWAVLAKSLAKIREEEPFFTLPGERKLPGISFGPQSPEVFFTLETKGQKKDLLRQERLQLHHAAGELLMQGSRYEITMPGTEDGVPFPDTGIWSNGWADHTLYANEKVFSRVRSWPLPDARRMEMPLEGQLCYGRERLRWGGKSILRGRAVLVHGRDLDLEGPFAAEGDFRILVFGKLRVGRGVRLDKAYLYATGGITLEEGAAVQGILACRRDIRIHEKAFFQPDPAVLGPFCTRYVF
ncbi:hypothetical protein [uncultured Acidaminococcus sp.]|uniref:hypothetical protein n=1 Tax=uncultured Acidaminococcus sp. TaxID=352152 RepID=UPI00262D3EC9|nr:hypothetical protein [uncultured Acidaminococcus sp.]